MARLYSHFYRVTQDISGNIVPGVQGTITLADTPTPATLYVDPEGTSTLPNPLYNSTQYGSFSVYLDTGHYDMSFFKEGYVFEPLQDIQISEASGGVASLVGTPNRVLVSASTGDIVLNAPQDLHPDATLQFAHLGLGTPGEGGLGLLVATGATFQAHMSAATITASGNVIGNAFSVYDHPGNNEVSFYTTHNTAGGTNRWAIYAGGDAPSHLQGSLNVATGLTAASLSITSNASVSGQLQVSGALTVQGALAVDGITTLNNTLTVNNTTRFNAAVGIAGAPDGYWLHNYGNSYQDGAATFAATLRVSGAAYFDGVVNLSSEAGHKLNVGGNAYITNSLGVGRGPEGGWSITNNGGLISYGAIQGNSTLYIATTGTFLGNVAICSTNLSTYQLFVNGTAGKVGGGSWSDVSSRALKRDIAEIPDALEMLLAQRGRLYEWEEPEHAALLPGRQYGLVYDEVTITQWKETAPDGTEILAIRGFEALTIEALRAIVARLEALERA